MRLSIPFVFSAILALAPSVTGSSSKADAKAAITSRQHHARRDLIDTCAYIKANLLENANVLGLPSGTDGRVDVCLCLSALPLYLETDTNIQALVKLLGKDAVSALLKTLIGSRGQQCNYPPQSKPFCSPRECCGFACELPYIKVGKACVCPSDCMMCNGQCVPQHQGCPSSLPKPPPHWKRSSTTRLNRRLRSRSINSEFDFDLSVAQKTCGSKYVCGEPNGSSQSFDCVDTMSDPESCGGCVSPYPTSSSLSAKGVNCRALLGVSEAVCLNGICAVKACSAGFIVDSGGTSCSPAPAHPPPSSHQLHEQLEADKKTSLLTRNNRPFVSDLDGHSGANCEDDIVSSDISSNDTLSHKSDDDSVGGLDVNSALGMSTAITPNTATTANLTLVSDTIVNYESLLNTTFLLASCADSSTELKTTLAFLTNLTAVLLTSGETKSTLSGLLDSDVNLNALVNTLVNTHINSPGPGIGKGGLDTTLSSAINGLLDVLANINSQDGVILAGTMLDLCSSSVVDAVVGTVAPLSAVYRGKLDGKVEGALRSMLDIGLGSDVKTEMELDDVLEELICLDVDSGIDSKIKSGVKSKIGGVSDASLDGIVESSTNVNSRIDSKLVVKSGSANNLAVA